eukprot:1194265-Prorocentrum_minimum.AAC.5
MQRRSTSESSGQGPRVSCDRYVQTSSGSKTSPGRQNRAENVPGVYPVTKHICSPKLRTKRVRPCGGCGSGVRKQRAARGPGSSHAAYTKCSNQSGRRPKSHPASGTRPGNAARTSWAI